jgi:hypothetical protein
MDAVDINHGTGDGEGHPSPEPASMRAFGEQLKAPRDADAPVTAKPVGVPPANSEEFGRAVEKAQDALAQSVQHGSLDRDPYRLLVAAQSVTLGIFPTLVHLNEGFTERNERAAERVEKQGRGTRKLIREAVSEAHLTATVEVTQNELGRLYEACRNGALAGNQGSYVTRIQNRLTYTAIGCLALGLLVGGTLVHQFDTSDYYRPFAQVGGLPLEEAAALARVTSLNPRPSQWNLQRLRLENGKMVADVPLVIYDHPQTFAPAAPTPPQGPAPKTR